MSEIREASTSLIAILAGFAFLGFTLGIVGAVVIAVVVVQSL